MLAAVEGADRVFNIVFFIVVVSAIIPGATIRPVSRWLGLEAHHLPSPPAVLEINARTPLHGELISFFIHEPVAVAGARLADIEFPEGVSVVLIVRGDDLIAPRGDSVLQPGDHAYVFVRPDAPALVPLLFGGPEA